jgi:hypothetical protein
MKSRGNLRYRASGLRSLRDALPLFTRLIRVPTDVQGDRSTLRSIRPTRASGTTNLSSGRPGELRTPRNR